MNHFCKRQIREPAKETYTFRLDDELVTTIPPWLTL